MSIDFASFVPHPPLLIPQIGKENLARLEESTKAYKKLAAMLELSGAETLLVISPHGQILDNKFTLNNSPQLNYNFEEFGDFATKGEFAGDNNLAKLIEDSVNDNSLVHSESDPVLDHGSAVPLILLAEKIKNIKVVPLYYSGRTNSEHIDFGRAIQKIIQNYPKKVAVIASGDLSHCLAKGAPAGYSPKGKKFDAKLIELLNNKQTESIVNLDESLVSEASECGLKSLLILLGILDKQNFTPKLLSYEAPFGVGYLAMNFKLS